MALETMHAIRIHEFGGPDVLVEETIARPTPGPDEVLVRVAACGVCRTDLHVCDGELTEPKLPLVPGHEIVGTVAAKGERVGRFAGRRPSWKKAFVTLQPGDNIEFFEGV